MNTVLTFPEFVAELTRALRERKPYSFTRYGDGEGIILGYPEHTKQVNMNGRLDKWFGSKHMGAGEQIQFANDMRQSIREADMIGIPGARHMEINVNWRSVGRYLSTYNLLRDDLRVCSMDEVLHLQTKQMYAELFKSGGVDGVHVISCRDVEPVLRKACNMQWVKSFFIPPQLRPCVGLNLSPERKHYPERYNDLRERLANKDMRGQVVLVGAGGLGKVYCMWIKRAGGIALDLGSVLDGWVGATTRSHICAQPEVWKLCR